MTGDAALQLMMAYEKGQLDNITSIVLRVARPTRRIPILINQWDDTEAIVFLTIIHNFDTTIAGVIKGIWSRILRRTLGSQNCIPCFRPLVLRLGLLGYHWPFRTGIFFTTYHHDIVAQAANVLQSIVEWNNMQKSNLHCDVLLLPALSTEPVAKAIYNAGFFPMPLPPTHLLDLRPHHGKTWNEYMKTLKRTNRRPYLQQFLNKGGIIEEVHDLSSIEVSTMICRQWENIARFRQEKNEPPTLVRPSVQFIAAIGHVMTESYRSAIFLRFNNEVIASSVIFKFPNKLLTTDIHGLTHEKARPMKAYFVMLQWVIKEALDKKYDFVDFGPTTPEPKIDLGCIQIPMEAGGYCGNPIIAFGIKKCGGLVDTVHMKKNPSQQATHEHKRFKIKTSSLTTSTQQLVASDLTHQIISNDSYVAQAQDSSERQHSTSAILQLDHINRLMNNNSSRAEILGDVIEISDKQAIYRPKNFKPIKKKKPVDSDSTDQFRQHSPNKHNFPKIKNYAGSKSQNGFLSTKDEHAPTIPLYQHENLNLSMIGNHNEANNSELMCRSVLETQVLKETTTSNKDTDIILQLTPSYPHSPYPQPITIL
ncbi:unnamed protein product [Rotaria sordida]|uniref:BioF2-like acetyltransferase domain-containing protein n=1 Tax=Rotaria sordida TaxID=392033 RepID=A0A818Q0M9_9BILA|nr:unnamed protein product [Rotaria sordida]